MEYDRDRTYRITISEDAVLKHKWLREHGYDADYAFLVHYRGESKTGLLRFGVMYWKKSWGPGGTLSLKPEHITSVKEIAVTPDTALVSRLVSRFGGISVEHHETTRIRGYHEVFGDFSVSATEQGWYISVRKTRTLRWEQRDGRMVRVVERWEPWAERVAAGLRSFGLEVEDIDRGFRVTVKKEA